MYDRKQYFWINGEWSTFHQLGKFVPEYSLCVIAIICQVQTLLIGSSFLKRAIPGLFLLFLSLQTNITICTTSKCEKMSIQYTVMWL